MNLRGLYAITDEILTPHKTIVSQVQRAIEAGVKIVQYRNKTASDDEVEDICIELQNICKKYGAIFILDDRIELANKIKADGIHIGKDDIPLVEARKIFGGIIGVSCYGELNRAIEAEKNGADYVAFGAFFETKTKQNASVVSLDILQKAKEVLHIPICVIGGINETNIDKFNQYNIDMISIVSGIFSNDDIQNNIKKLKNKMNREDIL